MALCYRDLGDFDQAVECLLRAGEHFQVNPADVKVGELESLLGDGKVMFTGK